MRFAGLREDAVADVEYHGVSAFDLEQALAFDHVKHLASRMGVPGIPHARLEANDVDPSDTGLRKLADHLHVDVAVERRAIVDNVAMQRIEAGDDLHDGGDRIRTLRLGAT